MKLPNLDSRCGKHLKYRNLVDCGDTWKSSDVNNLPKQLETYRALYRLATRVLDPVIEEFGQIALTYGVGTQNLISKIPKGIAPKLDQHASFEHDSHGNLICSRGGAACDFVVDGVDSLILAKWIARNTAFDRLYFYDSNAPIHVSVSENPSRKCSVVHRKSNGRVLPKTFTCDKFLTLRI